ncbi:MAG: pyruvate kinase, partial [Anaerolineaceae bacterium]|nr:pyruvate kinase [Anaerolineaceae bacterium]
RLNFSHGTFAEHQERITTLRTLSNELNRPISILQDLQGPKLRVGNLPGGSVQLVEGEIIALSSNPAAAQQDERYSAKEIIPFDVPDLEKSVQPGNRILMDDGSLEIEVTEVYPNTVEARVIIGGPLKSHKGVNLPRAKLNIPGFTEKDRADLEFGIHAGVDYVAISFVRNATDIETVREAIREISKNVSSQAALTPIIAKIELPEAVENLHEIIHAADGLMVARGDLGIEMSPQSVPNTQKLLIEEANRHAKIVITATQMLDSMINNPRPTRAEASDVANAIFDGSDAVMLSGETAAGKYPIESVKIMDAIIQEAEAHYDRWGIYKRFPDAVSVHTDALSITRAAKELAHDRDVSAIAVFTQAGRTALYMSKARPRVPILAFTPDSRTYQRLGLLWGVTPYLVPFATTVETMLTHVETAMMASSNLTPGQQVVLISGFPVGEMREPNFALLYTIGSIH